MTTYFIGMSITTLDMLNSSTARTTLGISSISGRIRTTSKALTMARPRLSLTQIVFSSISSTR